MAAAQAKRHQHGTLVDELSPNRMCKMGYFRGLMFKGSPMFTGGFTLLYSSFLLVSFVLHG